MLLLAMPDTLVPIDNMFQSPNFATVFNVSRKRIDKASRHNNIRVQYQSSEEHNFVSKLG